MDMKATVHRREINQVLSAEIFFNTVRAVRLGVVVIGSGVYVELFSSLKSHKV